MNTFLEELPGVLCLLIVCGTWIAMDWIDKRKAP